VNRIIGRAEQKAKLKTYFESENSEFVVVYGRRRVGKTFLVREYFNNAFDFQMTGLANSALKDQLVNFHAALQKYNPLPVPFANTWFQAFQQLIELLEQSKSERKVVFLDELPWIDTPKSGFLSAFEHFWNDWASARRDILLIVCGSATSWITGKLLNNKGGLHNRITRKMLITPFTLGECEEYLVSKNIYLNRYQIVDSYMILGGIPYYLSLLEKGLSLAQNIDNLFFSESGELRNEFKNLYASLFKNHENYVKVVETLAKKAKGLSRDEILSMSKLSDGGSATRILQELEECRFIRRYNALDKKTRDGIYQLTDFYTLFYVKFIQKNEYNDTHFWSNAVDSPQHRSWSGFAFEQVCLTHIDQIKRKLGITGVQCKSASWRSRTADPGAQIDLLIERKDQIINLCEMKYSTEEFSIDKSYSQTLRNKVSAFREETKTRKAIHLMMVTTYGLKHNEYSGMVQNEIVIDDLF
jgi:AAA+ ATPase superfamily predicted ATPase